MSAIAIVGASSQIAKDLIRSFAGAGRQALLLYVRDLDATRAWVAEQRLEAVCSVHGYETYGELAHDVVINFVGVGDPRRAAEMGASIFEITTRFDDMVLEQLIRHPSRRYLFLSSGAAYGNAFKEPVTATTQAMISINEIRPQDYYATAKLHAEVRHRARPDLAIIDVRVFNMFSRTQDIEARFFITDIVRAIRDKRTLQTTGDYMVRDFMHPGDFHRLVECLLTSRPANCAVDCYSREPIDKPSLLHSMAERFGLRYEVVGEPNVAVNATGAKPHYYSLNRKAAEFGYQPAMSSLEGIVAETAAILKGVSAVHSMETIR
jgi:nucleoside-diphosphate-sugar epimerase